MQDVTTNILKAALSTLYYTRMDAALAPITQGAGVIFMLHHVRPEPPAPFAPNRILSVTPEFLTSVIEHVRARDFDIVSLDEAYQRMVSGKTSRRRFATFTFDDGYRDNIEHALPICRRFGVPMTIYLAPDFCDGNGLAWWLTLEQVLAETESIVVPLADGEQVLPLTTVAEKYSALNVIYPWLRAMPDASVHCHVNRWAHAAGIDPFAACRALVMNWDEARAIAKDPLVTIGAHTMTHTSLAKCSRDEACWQMDASIEHVEHELGRDCRHFAYPYGDAGSAGPREFDIARALGVHTAVTTRKGLIARDVRGQLTGLPRLSLNGDFQDARYLRVLLSGAPFKMMDLAKAALPRRAA
ncbi:MAG: polysaccharide deacetylase family protein [Hyphomicrobiaceae bacterium]